MIQSTPYQEPDQPEERPSGARFITELKAVIRRADAEEKELDDNALARDVTTTGFRLETQSFLQLNQVVVFELELSDRTVIRGTARVASLRKEAAYVAQMIIDGMTRSDRKKLRRTLHPDDVDWARVIDSGFTAACVILAAAALHRMLRRSDLHPHLLWFAARAVPVIVSGWAVLALLKKPERFER